MRSLLFLTIFLSLQVEATTFIPVPVERQLKEATGVVFAKYKGETYKRNSNGEVVTVGSFEIKKSVGIKNKDIINKNNFQILYPGGKWQGLVYKVYGSPKFKSGEDVVLILNKSKQGYYVKGLSMGKYELFQEYGKSYLKSSVFPTHPKLGKISLSKFEDQLNYRFGATMSEVNSDKYVFTKEEKIKTENTGARAPASISVEKDNFSNKEENKIGTVWLVLLFALLGAYTLHRARKKN